MTRRHTLSRPNTTWPIHRMTMESSFRVTVNAGGRLYETTTATLLSSGSPFFEDLLRPYIVDIEPTTPSRRSVFLDCDSDLFADVLYFLRRRRLPHKTTCQASRLADLHSEAMFFDLDALQLACDHELAKLQNMEPTAESFQLQVIDGEPVWLHVRQGQLIYIVSATFVCSNFQCLDRNDSYLHVIRGDRLIQKNMSSIASYHIRENNMHTQQGNLPICLSSPENERVGLTAQGLGRWDVICWVGDGTAIPGLWSKTSHSTQDVSSLPRL